MLLSNFRVLVTDVFNKLPNVEVFYSSKGNTEGSASTSCMLTMFGLNLVFVQGVGVWDGDECQLVSGFISTRAVTVIEKFSGQVFLSPSCCTSYSERQ